MLLRLECCALLCEAFLRTSPPGCVWKALTLIWSPFSVHYAGPPGRPQQIRTISTPLTSSLKLKWHSLHPTCHTHTHTQTHKLAHTDQRPYTNTDSWTCEDVHATHSWTLADPDTYHTYKFPQIDNPSKDTHSSENTQAHNTHTHTELLRWWLVACYTQSIPVSLAQWDFVLAAIVFSAVWTTLTKSMCVCADVYMCLPRSHSGWWGSRLW